LLKNGANEIPNVAQHGRLLDDRVNCRLQFHKRSQLFILAHDESLSVVAMCVCNPDGSPVGIHG
jgi:hypothetical protein